MRNQAIIALCGILLLAGCAETGSGQNKISHTTGDTPVETIGEPLQPAQPGSTAFTTAELDEKLRQVFDEYLRLSALIAADGGANPERIETVTSASWAETEKQSAAALREIGSTLSGEMTVTKWETASTRGRLKIIDAVVHACLSRDSIRVTDSAGVETSASGITMATIHFVASANGFVVDDITPWEDASWCAA